MMTLAAAPTMASICSTSNKGDRTIQVESIEKRLALEIIEVHFMHQKLAQILVFFAIRAVLLLVSTE